MRRYVCSLLSLSVCGGSGWISLMLLCFGVEVREVHEEDWGGGGDGWVC